MPNDSEESLLTTMTEEVLEALHEIAPAPFENAVAEPDQFRYIINLDERGLFSASLYAILPNGQDGSAVWHFDTDEARFLTSERVRIREGQSVVDYEAGFGLLPHGSTAIGASASPRMIDPFDSNEWTFHEVDAAQAALLRQLGEVVIEHSGFKVSRGGSILLWCRNRRTGLGSFGALREVS